MTNTESGDINSDPLLFRQSSNINILFVYAVSYSMSSIFQKLKITIEAY